MRRKKRRMRRKKRRMRRKKRRMRRTKRRMRRKRGDEEKEEEDEEKDEEDEDIAKYSGDVDKEDDFDDDGNNVVEKDLEGTYVGTVASQSECNVERETKPLLQVIFLIQKYVMIMK
eukprot:Em0006g1393a